jgi:hypothetical protein
MFPETISSGNNGEENYLSESFELMVESWVQLNALYEEIGADVRMNIIL